MACGPNVDRARPLAGAAALRVADLAWQGDPRRLPPTSEPHPGDRLVRGSPGGVWARTSPCIGGLSVASGMVIPQRCTCSNRTEDGGWLADMAVQISSLSGIEGWAPCYPAFSQLVLIHEWHRDGVNHTILTS
jgi:hypothetical protein